MIIRKLYLEHFGRFQEKEWELSSGLNIIYGDNESGKTTIHTFIRAMLFGMEKRELYTRYLPWDTPGLYSGYLEVKEKGEEYSIYRNFHRNAKEVQCINRKTGERVPVIDGKPEFLPAGLTISLFHNTAGIEQDEIHTEKKLVSDLDDYIANLSSGTQINITLALKQLESKEKAILAGKIPERLELLNRRMEEKNKKNGHINQYQNQLCGLIKDYNQGEERIKQACERQEERQIPARQQERIGRRRTGALLTAVFGVLVLIAGILEKRMEFMGPGEEWFLFSGILMLVMGIYGMIQRQKEPVPVTSKSGETADSQWDYFARWLEEERKRQEEKRVRIERLKWEIECMEEELLQEEGLLEEIELLTESARENREDLEAIRLAGTAITEISHKLKEGFAIELNQNMSELFTKITGERYQRIAVDRNLKMKAEQEYHLIDMEYLSRGTKDQIYLTQRMAVGGMMDQAADIPFILDDSFVFCDDTRMEALLDVLAKEQRQILIFTCHKREAEYLSRRGRVFHHIVL